MKLADTDRYRDDLGYRTMRNIKFFRIIQGFLKAEDLAILAQIKPTTYFGYENCSREINLDILARIALALQVPPELLVCDLRKLLWEKFQFK